jgi:hypothetical protein
LYLLDPIREKYPFASLTEVMIRMPKIKQMENEGPLDHDIERFKQSRDKTKSHVGTDMLNKVEKTRKYQEKQNAAKKQAMKDTAFNKWMACLLSMRNSDQGGKHHHGSLLNGLASQF